MTTAFQGEVLLVGCGRLGSAIVEGWLKTGAVDPARLLIQTPSAKPVADRAAGQGARLNPDPARLASVRAVVLAVKPAAWRAVTAPLFPHLPPDCVVVSVMAGVSLDDLARGAAPRPVARVMPTTAVAQGAGVAALLAQPLARETALALFAPMADVAELDAETHFDVATAVAGSGPAFVYAFVQALAQAGVAGGLGEEQAARLARGALRSAGAGLETGQPLAELIGRIASPGGMTQAGLDAMASAPDLCDAARQAIDGAVARARTLAG